MVEEQVITEASWHFPDLPNKLHCRLAIMEGSLGHLSVVYVQRATLLGKAMTVTA